MHGRRILIAAAPVCAFLLAFVGVAAAHGAALTQVTNCGASCTGLSSPQAVAASADGKHVYVVTPSGGSQSNGQVWVYSRNATSGALNFQQTFSPNGNSCLAKRILKGATGIAVSPDGKNVYVASSFNNSIVVLDRNAGNGQVSCNSQVVDDTNLRKAQSVSVSPDNKSVYATATTAGQDRVTVYSRNTSTGVLTFVATYRDNTAAGGNSLGGPTSAVTSPTTRTSM
jgi:YVTN family beta-propeller protein